ncbi:hypothetical protein V2J09_004756 [Rumex salicifolius]
MGAGSSSIREDSAGPSPESSGAAGLGDLSEGCAASVLMYLEPRDICRMAALNQAFRGASSADFVWESKLPSNYQALIEKVVDGFPLGLSKKDMYALLCRVNSIDGGSKKVWLDKSTGGICMAISFKGLTVTGIDDRRYWNILPSEESRFSTLAYLQQIWWFEINGEVEFPFPAGTYSIFFRVQLGRTFKRFGRKQCNTENVHGWDIKPVQFQLSTSDGQHAVSKCFVEEPGKWAHYHVGDFRVESPNKPMRLKFSMAQIDCTHTKGGLCLDSVVIYPTGFKERMKCY